MTITDQPLHRSGRALLTHPAPALGDDAKSSQRIRVMKQRRWQPTVNQTVHLLPGQPRPLTATPERPVPVTGNMKAKRSQRPLVRRHPVIPVVSLHHGPQPLTYFGNWLAHSFSQFRFDFRPPRAFPLLPGAPIDREHPVASLRATNVREAKEVECLGLPFSSLVSISSAPITN